MVDVIAKDNGKDNGKNIQNTKKTAYLTFDDGPSCLTEKYLDILESEGASEREKDIQNGITGTMLGIICKDR